MKFRFVLSCFAGLIALISWPAYAAGTLESSATTKSGWTGCDAPNASAIFSVSDPEARLWFTVTGVGTGDVGSVEWYDPSGSRVKSGSYNAANFSGRGCYGDPLPIAGNSRALGPWVVKILWNGSIIGSVTFSIGPINPRAQFVVDWIIPPPGTLNSGQSFGVKFRLDGDSSMSYRIHYGTDPNPATYATVKTDWRNATPGEFTESLTAPTVNSRTDYYIVVHAYINNLDYFSITAKTSVNSTGGGQSPSAAVQWTVAPPTSIQNGQSFPGKWRINNAPGVTYSHIHVGFDRNSLMSNPALVVRPDAGNDGLQQQNIRPNDALTGPLSPASAVYYVVHASNGSNINYYSDVAQSTVGFATAGSGRNIWVYSADPTRVLRTLADQRFKDFYIVIEKKQVGSSGQKYEYNITVLGDNLLELQSAFLTMIVHKDVEVDPNSFVSLRRANIPGGGLLQNMLAGSDGGWEDLSVLQPMIDFGDGASRVVRDLVGFIPYVGTGSSVIEGFQDLASFFKESKDLYPSFDFSMKAHDINNYHRIDFAAMRLRQPFFFSGDLVYGVRFIAQVDESNGKPVFFLKAKNSRDAFVGLELGADSGSPVQVLRQN